MAGNKRGVEAGRAFVKAWLDDSLVIRGLKRMQTGIRRVGAGLSKLGTMTVGGVLGGGLVASVAGLSKVAQKLEEIATIDRVAKAFGLATEKASGLFGVFAAAGATNARENIESLVTLSGRINDVLTGTGEESKKLFAGLSVSAEELSKLPLDEQFFRLHEAILQLSDPVDRVNRLMLAFGEDGGKTLIGTLSLSTAELRKQAGQLAISGQEAEDAAKGQKALASASAAVSKVWTGVAVTIAPAVTLLANGLTDLAGRAPWLAKAIVGGAAALLGLGVAAVVTGSALTGMMTVLGLLGSAIAFLTTPIGLVVLAAGTIGAAFVRAAHRTGRLGKAVDWLKDRFAPLAETAQKALQGIKDALSAGDFKLAAEIGLAGLKLAWVQTTNEIATLWDEFVGGLDRIFGGFFSGVASQLDGLTHRAAGLVEVVKGKIEAQEQEWRAQALEGQIRQLEGERGRATMTDDPERAKQTEFWGDSDDLRLEGLRQQLRVARDTADYARQRGADLNAAAQQNADRIATERANAAEARRKKEEEAAEKLAGLLTDAMVASVTAEQREAEATEQRNDGQEEAAGDQGRKTPGRSPGVNTAAIVGSEAGNEALAQALDGAPGDRQVKATQAVEKAVKAGADRVVKAVDIEFAKSTPGERDALAQRQAERRAGDASEHATRHEGLAARVDRRRQEDAAARQSRGNALSGWRAEYAQQRQAAWDALRQRQAEQRATLGTSLQGIRASAVKASTLARPTSAVPVAAPKPRDATGLKGAVEAIRDQTKEMQRQHRETLRQGVVIGKLKV